MSKSIKDEHVDNLFKAILSLKTIKECYAFFEDLCTVSEIKALTQRLDVAKMLLNGKKYKEVASITGASTATISRVNKCLNYGEDGYKLIIERLNSSNDK